MCVCINIITYLFINVNKYLSKIKANGLVKIVQMTRELVNFVYFYQYFNQNMRFGDFLSPKDFRTCPPIFSLSFHHIFRRYENALEKRVLLSSHAIK